MNAAQREGSWPNAVSTSNFYVTVLTMMTVEIGEGVKKLRSSFKYSPMHNVQNREKFAEYLSFAYTGFSTQYCRTPQNMLSLLQCWPVIGYWCNLQLIFRLIANKKTSSQSRGYCLALVRPLAGKNFGKSCNTENQGENPDWVATRFQSCFYLCLQKVEKQKFIDSEFQQVNEQCLQIYVPF